MQIITYHILKINITNQHLIAEMTYTCVF